MKINTFLKECSEKEVFKMLSIYIVSSWVLIQVLAVTWQPLALPEKSVTYLILLLLIGFPIYIFYIWKSRLAPLEKEKDLITKTGRVKTSKFQKMYFSFLTLISMLSVLAVFLLSNNAFTKKVKLVSALETSDKIGVLKFGNNTGDFNFDVIGKMSADWISHGITENKLAQVVSPEIVTDYMGVIKESESTTDDESVLKKYFKPAKVISGNYYLNGDKLIFQCSITDGNIDKTLFSFKPIECDKENPLECIEFLKQKVLGYLIIEESGKLNLEQVPPKYNAYQYFLDAKENFADNEMYISLLNKAVEADSNFFEAKVMIIAYHYNQKEYKIADSLRKSILPSARISNRQRNLLQHYEALIKGDNAAIYTTIKKEYNFAPFDLYSNASTMVVAHQFVNRPQDVDTIFKKISMMGMEVVNCTHCQFRYFIQASADVDLKKYEEVIDLLSPVLEEVDKPYLKRPVIASYIRLDDFDGLIEFFNKQELVTSRANMAEAYMFALKELVLSGNDSIAANYITKIEALPNLEESRKAEIAYLKKDYIVAEDLFIQLYTKDSLNNTILSRLAVSLDKNGKKTEAEKIINKLNGLKSDYQYGSIDYSLAQYYASIGDEENAYKHLLKATIDGDRNDIQKYQDDYHFKNIKDTEEFNNILTYWY